MWLLLAAACTPDSEPPKPAPAEDSAGTDTADTGPGDSGEGCPDWRQHTFYQDADGDRYGAPGTETAGCGEAPDGWSYNDLDCDDTDAGVNPSAQEDCATPADEDCADGSNGLDGPGCVDWYVDADGDGTGGADAVCACDAWGEYTATASDDCDDDDASADCTPDVDRVADARSVASARATIVYGTSTCTTLTRDHGDATGDAGTDLVFTCDDDRVVLVPADGTGAYDLETAAVGSLTLDTKETFAGAADLTGDGVLDLYVSWEDGATDFDTGGYFGELLVSRVPGPWALGRTTGEADLATGDSTDSHPGVAGLVGDVDGDGIADAAWSPGSWFSGSVYFAPDGASTGGAASVSAWNSLETLDSAGDTNGDGLADLLLYDGYGASVFESPFDAYRPSTETDAWVGEVAAAPLAAGDVDGDGYGDVFVEYAGTDYLLRGPFAGTGEVYATDIAWASLTAGYELATAELDGDVGAELLVGQRRADRSGVENTGAVFVVLDPPSGAIDPGSADRVWYGAGGDRVGTAITPLPDLDGDGADDVALGGGTGVWILGAP